MSTIAEQIINDILVSRETRPGRPARWPFFRNLSVGESYLVACTSTEKTGIQTKLCIAKYWYERRLGLKFRTRRVPKGVCVERVA